MRATLLVLLAVPSAAFVAPSLSRPAQATAFLPLGQPSNRVAALSASGPFWTAGGGLPDRAFGCEFELLSKGGFNVEHIQAAVQEAEEQAFVSDEVISDTTECWKIVLERPGSFSPGPRLRAREPDPPWMRGPRAPCGDP